MTVSRDVFYKVSRVSFVPNLGHEECDSETPLSRRVRVAFESLYRSIVPLSIVRTLDTHASTHSVRIFNFQRDLRVIETLEGCPETAPECCGPIV